MKNKPFKLASDGAYCPIKVEIRAVDSQSDLRIWYSYNNNNNNSNNNNNNYYYNNHTTTTTNDDDDDDNRSLLY